MPLSIDGIEFNGVTDAEMALMNPADTEGCVIYNSTQKKMFYSNGINWVKLATV